MKDFKEIRYNRYCHSKQYQIQISISIAPIIDQIITLDVVFCQTEIVLKDSTAFVYVTKSEKSSHFTLMT